MFRQYLLNLNTFPFIDRLSSSVSLCYQMEDTTCFQFLPSYVFLSLKYKNISFLIIPHCLIVTMGSNHYSMNSMRGVSSIDGFKVSYLCYYFIGIIFILHSFCDPIFPLETCTCFCLHGVCSFSLHPLSPSLGSQSNSWVFILL